MKSLEIRGEKRGVKERLQGGLSRFMRGFTPNRELDIVKHMKERNHSPYSMQIPNGRFLQTSPSTRSSTDSAITAL